MTNQGVKFYKFNNHTTSAANITTAKAVEGAIIYIVDLRQLWIGGATPKLVVSGANEVTFANNALTIKNYSEAGVESTQTLDFSDVASAEQTFHVFENVYGLMGATASESTQTLDYSNTNYLTSATTLVGADKALDAAIHEATLKDGVTGATYDTTAQEISQTWITTVTTNEIADNEALNTSVNKLDKKIAGLADELIRDEQVTQEAFTAVSNSVGLEQDMSLDLSSASQTGAIHNDTDVKSALIHLDNAISTNQLDVQVGGTSIVNNHVANIITEGTYNSSSNKIATQSTVSDAINTLDVSTDKGAASISGSTITINAVQQENGLIKDGGSTTINLDGTYDASTNKIATKSTVTSAIDAIGGAGLAVDNAGVITATTQSAGDNTTNVATTAFVKNAIDALDGSATIASVANNVVTIKTGVAEADGVISNATGTDIVLEEVAVTGAAADVSIVDAQSKITATNVEDALTELATSIEGLVGGMRYNGDIDSATATLNTTTNDIRPGDIYLASDAFSIGTTSVEAGDMIVYKGTTSSSAVALTNSNCTIIERETDTMVTAGDTLTDNYLVFGDGNKAVSVTSTVNSNNYQVTASDLKTAIENANSALQTISNGTDGTYVTTTIGTKANNEQTIGVALTEGEVTYTAATGGNPANLSVESGDDGVLTTDAVTPIKNYIDAKVGTAVQSVAASSAEAAKSVTQSDYATVKVTATTDANNNVTLDSAVGLTVQAVSTSDPSSAKGLAEASDVKSYVDNEIDALDGSATIASVANNVVTIKTGVTETDGVISNTTGTTDIVLEEVAVTGAAADVSYNNSTSGMTATTVQAAIDELKSGLCWEAYE